MAWWSGVVRPKGHIERSTLYAIAAMTLLPVVVALCRILALPGQSLYLPGLGLLWAFGDFLNQYFVFDWIPPADRPSILFLLLLPTGALLVAIFRLTLGIRVLGLRAILLAMGFQAIGMLPSLVLMVAVIGTIAAVRPWLRRIRVPLYGRLTFVLCLSAALMLGAALIGPWLGSEAVWRAAFFPAIIMAMMAESIAKTLEQDDGVVAAWRGAWTVVLALLLALLDEPVIGLTYEFPELVVTQLMAIVLVAEFLDLRLLEPWPERLSRYLSGERLWFHGRPRVALVRNRGQGDTVSPLGRPAPDRYQRRSVQSQVDALRERGFVVKVFEGDRQVVRELARFLRPDHLRGTPGGIVLNLATGVQGEGRFLHVPAALEMAGFAYTGPDPAGHAILADRFALMTLLGRSQVPVPKQLLVADPAAPPAVTLPAIVRPRFEPDGRGHVVSSRRALRSAVRSVRSAYGQAAVVEPLTRGRKLAVSLLGNEQLEVLPLVEVVRRAPKICPADVDAASASRIRALARAAFHAAGCRDYARVDVRLPSAGEPVVVDVRWENLFARRGAFLTAAAAAGYGLADVMQRIVSEAAKRYGLWPSPEPELVAVADVVSLAERRVVAG